MRRLLITAVVCLTPYVATAKEVTLTFTDEEQNALVQVLDIATKSGGLQVSGATMHFLNKIKSAQQAEEPKK